MRTLLLLLSILGASGNQAEEGETPVESASGSGDTLTPPNHTKFDCDGNPIIRAYVDFNRATNPALLMEWTDATEANFNGIDNAAVLQTAGAGSSQSATGTFINWVQPQLTDQNGAPFPGGNLRIRNAGEDNGVLFDLVFTVPDNPTQYGELLPIEYVTPTVSTATQVAITTGGFVCLGFGLRTAVCESGASVDFYTAECPGNEKTIMRGTEFEVKMVLPGTDTLLPDPHSTTVVFYDVDGDDSIGSGQLYEVNGVIGAVRVVIDPSSTLEHGTFYPSEAEYAIATEARNVITDLTNDFQELSGDSLLAIASFELAALAKFRLMVGGRSAVPVANDRGYCFTMRDVTSPPPACEPCVDLGYPFSPGPTDCDGSVLAGDMPWDAPQKQPGQSPGCSHTVTDDTDTIGQCAWPANTLKYTAIVKENATLEAHNFYTALAVCGRLTDGSPWTTAVVGDKATTHSCIGSINDGADPYALGPYSKDPYLNIHWKSGADVGGCCAFPDWAHFDDLANRLVNGTYGMYTIHVVDQCKTGQSWYNLRSFMPYWDPAQGEDQGRTLVVFRECCPVYLHSSFDGRQFGPSVLAPCAPVILYSDVGFVDGIIIAKNLGYLGDTSEVQLHGDPYLGPLVCRPPCKESNTTTTTTTTVVTSSSFSPSVVSKTTTSSMPSAANLRAEVEAWKKAEVQAWRERSPEQGARQVVKEAAREAQGQPVSQAQTSSSMMGLAFLSPIIAIAFVATVLLGFRDGARDVLLGKAVVAVAEVGEPQQGDSEALHDAQAQTIPGKKTYSKVAGEV